MRIIDIAKIKDADELRKICLQEKRRSISKPVKQRGAKQNDENNSRQGK